jgi:hypothetical protein
MKQNQFKKARHILLQAHMFYQDNSHKENEFIQESLIVYENISICLYNLKRFAEASTQLDLCLNILQNL